jgi:hypothetical protein
LASLFAYAALKAALKVVEIHLEGCLESGINIRIIGETNPTSTTMAGEYSTQDGFLKHASYPGHPPADRQLT